MPKKLTFTEVVERARAVHGDRYEYLRLDESLKPARIVYRCAAHGEVVQNFNNHVKGSGCNACGRAAAAQAFRSDFAEAVAKATVVHGERYSYQKLTVEGGASFIHYTCPEHGDYRQSLHTHLKGRGCKLCADAANGARKALPDAAWLEQFRVAHGSTYTYLRLFRGAGYTKYVAFLCPQHGEQVQPAVAHAAGRACRACAMAANGVRARKSEDAFLGMMTRNGSKLVLTPGSFTDMTSPVEVTCGRGHTRLHGAGHVGNGGGCGLCAVRVSRPNLELSAYLTELGVEHELEYKLDGRKSVDLFVPEHKLAIDYHGLIWHSTRFIKEPSRHLDRLKLAEAKGWTYLQIFADEWEHNQPAVKARIAHLCGLGPKGVGARQCAVVEVPTAEAREFLNRHHIQGCPPNTGTSLGLRFKGELLAVALLSSALSRRGATDGSTSELVRYATAKPVAGGLGKLLKHFRAASPGLSIVTYSDRRMFSGKLYEQLGFRQSHINPPGYSYVTAGLSYQRLHKSNFQKSRIAKRFGLDITGRTETELTEQLGYYKVFDCGKVCWVLE